MLELTLTKINKCFISIFHCYLMLTNGVNYCLQMEPYCEVFPKSFFYSVEGRTLEQHEG